jgi:hypothetical protein
MNVKKVYEKGPNLVIRANLYRLKFAHTCIVCGKCFRIIGPDGKVIPSTPEEREKILCKIDNIHYTDSHGICDECYENLEE